MRFLQKALLCKEGLCEPQETKGFANIRLGLWVIAVNPLQTGSKLEGVVCGNRSPMSKRRSSVLRDHVYGETGQVRKKAALNYRPDARRSAEWSNGAGPTLFATGSHRWRASIQSFFINYNGKRLIKKKCGFYESTFQPH